MATRGADVFGRKKISVNKPITADMCVIAWGGENTNGTDTQPIIFAGATNVRISYTQQIIRRYTLGGGANPQAVIYPTRPMGNMQMGRMFAQAGDSNPGDLFDLPGWNTCKGTAYLDVRFNGSTAYEGCTAGTYGGFHISGASVVNYDISAEADGLTVVDNVAIEFLQMNQLEA